MTMRIGADLTARISQAWPELLSAVAAGLNIGKACEGQGLTRAQVYAYQRDNPEARKQWELAREESADAYADRIADILDTPGADAQIARLRVDGLKWLASKRNPKLYSDKATLDVNVRTVDLTRIIQDANARLASARNPALADRAAAAVDAEILSPALKSLIG